MGFCSMGLVYLLAVGVGWLLEAPANCVRRLFYLCRHEESIGSLLFSFGAGGHRVVL